MKTLLRLMFALLIVAGVSLAQGQPATPIPAPPAIPANGYFLQDFNSGRILAEKNAGERMEPASITKLMTAFVVFTFLDDNNITLDDLVTVSEKAWRTEGSRMFIEVGSQVSIKELLQGMIIQSGNDAAVALAEHVAGSEEGFAALMNQYAGQLGMNDSRYENSTGLPSPGHYTTARDIALLTHELIGRFNQYYQWYSVKEYTYNGIQQHNRNQLLWRDDSVDGVKTGHTDAAGFCLVASAERNNMRLVSVVLGTESKEARTKSSEALLNYGFNFYETHRLFEANHQVTEKRVWKGISERVGLGLREDLYVTIPRGQYDLLKAVMDVDATVVAPVSMDQSLGSVRITLAEEPLAARPLHPLNNVQEGGLWRRVSDEVLLWFE